MSAPTVWYDDSKGVRHTHRVTRVKGQIYLDHSHVGTFPRTIGDKARAALDAEERAMR
jgi:hypothetical protein